jgi:hypothetical protein
MCGSQKTGKNELQLTPLTAGACGGRTATANDRPHSSDAQRGSCFRPLLSTSNFSDRLETINIAV